MAFNILIVDDSKIIRSVIKKTLEISGVPVGDVFEASNGLEGLTVMREHWIDLVFADLNMPVMNGWDFILALKKEYEDAGKSSGTPIVVLSSTSGEKGVLFMKKSVHDGKKGYKPMVTVAKESCVDKRRYDTDAKKGLTSWLKFFVKDAKENN